MVSTPARTKPETIPVEHELMLAQFPIVLRLPSETPLTDELLLQISDANDGWRFERTERGELLIMPPATNSSDEISAELTRQLGNWIRSGVGGMLQGSSGGFAWPDGRVRSPDAAWVSRERLAALSPEAREQTYLPACPTFVIEVRSPGESIPSQQRRLEEWLECGTELGWLVVPEDETVHVYRVDGTVEVIQRPETLSTDPICPGLVISFEYAWDLESAHNPTGGDEPSQRTPPPPFHL